MKPIKIYPSKLVCLFTLLILASYSFHSQKHNDLAEYGYKGKVKQVTTYNYDSRFQERVYNKISNEQDWRTKRIFNFNKAGNFESIYTYIKLPNNNDSIIGIITTYIYLANKRVAIRQNSLGQITDSIKYITISDTVYQTVEYNLIDGSKIVSHLELTSTYRDHSRNTRAYTKDLSIKYAELYVNTLDSNNLLVKSLTTNLLSNESKNIGYRYSNFDKKKNPKKVVVYDILNDTIINIAVRNFIYY